MKRRNLDIKIVKSLTKEMEKNIKGGDNVMLRCAICGAAAFANGACSANPSHGGGYRGSLVMEQTAE
jgi:hypothetical protein